MRTRPGLVANYRADAAIFRSATQKIWFAALIVVGIVGAIWMARRFEEAEDRIRRQSRSGP